jgi:hypothetical protein
MTQVLDEFKNGAPDVSIYSHPGTRDSFTGINIELLRGRSPPTITHHDAYFEYI